MKVLWFTNTPSLYDQGQHHYHGGGWIEALEYIIGNDGEIDLGVAFFHRTGSTKVKRNNTTYFPINRPRARKNPFQYLTPPIPLSDKTIGVIGRGYVGLLLAVTFGQ